MLQVEEVTAEVPALVNPQHKSIFESGPKGQPPNILNSLKRDHDVFKTLYQEYNTTKSKSDRERIAKEIMKGVDIHDKIEELVFYPALRDCGMEMGNNYVKQSLLDHENVRSSVYELNILFQDEGVESQMFNNFFNKMMTDFIAHAELEEHEVFKFCQKLFDDKKLAELGKELDEMRKMGGVEKKLMEGREEVEKMEDAEEAGGTEVMEEVVE
ncbi:hemerythrin domain-containing protein [Gigaspora margarita]|uniref:Hemerythrin domain-containing protein n=1 Tax=Gigaspora margarita TaxID=4874 RepID=A0A8H4EN73_GIGMA|nr:hemerythrin domain-containing protein [Gigaspora margarita]